MPSPVSRSLTSTVEDFKDCIGEVFHYQESQRGAGGFSETELEDTKTVIPQPMWGVFRAERQLKELISQQSPKLPCKTS